MGSLSVVIALCVGFISGAAVALLVTGFVSQRQREASEEQASYPTPVRLFDWERHDHWDPPEDRPTTTEVVEWFRNQTAESLSCPNCGRELAALDWSPDEGTAQIVPTEAVAEDVHWCPDDLIFKHQTEEETDDDGKH